MLTSTELKSTVSMLVPPPLEDHLEISRLLAAAVVNPGFCHTLLVDPEQAIKNGYQGESFFFSESSLYLLLSIRAGSLVELAQQIVQAFGIGLNKKSSSFTVQNILVGC